MNDFFNREEISKLQCCIVQVNITFPVHWSISIFFAHFQQIRKHFSYSVSLWMLILYIYVIYCTLVRLREVAYRNLHKNKKIKRHALKVDRNPGPAQGIPCTDELPLSHSTPVTKTLLENYLRQKRSSPPVLPRMEMGEVWCGCWLHTYALPQGLPATDHPPPPTTCMYTPANVYKY